MGTCESVTPSSSVQTVQVLGLVVLMSKVVLVASGVVNVTAFDESVKVAGFCLIVNVLDVVPIEAVTM
ncbi:MAG: hypothetical protein IKG90_03085 [Bacteroidales bacterium]|nr:hypothetical protein [Bacteroidales bacterium]